MPKIITPLKKAEVIAQRELGLGKVEIAKNTKLDRGTVTSIIENWTEDPENSDFQRLIPIYKRKLTNNFFNVAARCVNLTDDDIYNKSTPFQRVTMAAISIDKALLLTGQATSIVQLEEVDEDVRARYLRLIDERKRTIDVTPSPAIVQASPATAPQDTSGGTPEPQSTTEQAITPTSPTESQWQRMQAHQPAMPNH